MGSIQNWDTMLLQWRMLQGKHRRVPYGSSVYNNPVNFLDGIPPDPAPQWRGSAQEWFLTHPPPLGYDIADRVYDIALHFALPYEGEDEDSEEEVKKKEELLDELQAYVESVDVAKLLHQDTRLFPFLHHVLPNKHAGIRAKGSEVVTTMVEKYPTSRQLVIKEKGLKLLFQNFTSDPDATSRTKALGAICSLIRNNEPGITAFRLANGYAALRDALNSESVVSFQREALNLIQYLLHENSSDCNIVTELGLPRIMMHLTSNDGLEVREAALRVLLILARDEGGTTGQLVKNDDKLKQVLKARIEGISAMAPEDLGAAREERQLVDSLWNACYNEPSSLGEKGLLVLPGEDALAPDVAASKLFEPPLRAAAEAADIPPSAATPTVQSKSKLKRKLH